MAVRETTSEIRVPAGEIVWRWTIRIWRIVVEIPRVGYIADVW